MGLKAQGFDTPRNGVHLFFGGIHSHYDDHEIPFPSCP